MSNMMDITQLMVITALLLGVFCTSASAEENSTSGQILSRERRDGYHHEHYHYRHKHRCYQCSYSPPKHVYQHEHYGYGGHGGAGGGGGGGGFGGGGFGGGHGHGHGGYGHSHSHYLNGGWEKCLGPFDHYQAEAYGIDTWDCHYNNCYVRKDPNGDIFRGCYKGEYDVDPYKLGCHPQGGSIYCFCEGELCNNGEVGYHYH